MVQSVTRDLYGTFASALATGHNRTLARRTPHTVASAPSYLPRSGPQELARKGTIKSERVTTRHDSPRVVTSSRRVVAVAVLG